MNPYMQWTDPGLHRSRPLVSRRDDGVQPDEGRPCARRGGARDLASGRRGSVDLERHRQGRIAAQPRQPAQHAIGIRRRVRWGGRDPSDPVPSQPPAIGTSRVDSKGYITSSSIVQVPIPYVVAHTGGQERNKHRVALTFDDGPDGRWTPMILDTLRSRGAKATFFVVGQNVDTDQRLLERMYDEGHEIGNHTYRHPNLALASGARAVLEIDMTTQLVSSVLNRRMAFFRPPYFGDAEPTTERRARAGRHRIAATLLDDRPARRLRGLAGVRTRIRSSPTCCASASIRASARRPAQDSTRNIILMHDSGGDRSATVAALGPLIDSLRARGDTLVLVSDLAGISRDEAMPPLPADHGSDALLHARRLPRARRRRDAHVLGVQHRRGARHRTTRRHRPARPDRAAARPQEARRDRATTHPA